MTLNAKTLYMESSELQRLFKKKNPKKNNENPKKKNHLRLSLSPELLTYL